MRSRRWLLGPFLGFFLRLSPAKPIKALSSLRFFIFLWGVSGAPTPELPGSYPTPNSPDALELPSRVGNPGPEPPDHSHPEVGLTRSTGGPGEWRPEETGLRWMGESYIEVAKELGDPISELVINF